jgi:hypothetical protein
VAFDVFSQKVNGGDSHTNSKGNSCSSAIEYGKTYKINSGVMLTGIFFMVACGLTIMQTV